MMPGSDNGSVMVRNAQAGRAPNVRAASSSRRSTASMERRMARTIKGKPMIAAASAAPVQRKAKVIPRVCSKNRPSGPCVPNSINNARPVTTGGRTSGNSTRPLTTLFPGNSKRAST